MSKNKDSVYKEFGKRWVSRKIALGKSKVQIQDVA